MPVRAHDSSSLPVYLVKGAGALIGRDQMDNVKLLHHRHQFVLQTVTAVEERVFKQRRPNAVIPIDGDHSIIGLELSVLLVCMVMAYA